MQRFWTAIVASVLFLAAIFLLPTPWFLGFVLLGVTGAAVEFVRIARPACPGAPLALLPWLVPPVAVLLYLAPAAAGTGSASTGPLLVAALAATVGLGTLVLLARTPAPEALAALGALGFGTPYFAVPAVACARLQQLDPWLMFLPLAIVAFGDTAAYYVGRRFGRHRLAPRVSPNKSWEGAAASLAIAVAVAALWGTFRLGAVPAPLLALGAAIGVAGQLGDLVESLLKRGSGVKDSGSLLPGHGGLYDRVDALLFAMPVALAGVLWIGPEKLLPAV